MRIRAAERADRERIHEILAACVHLTGDEVRDALESFDLSLSPGRADHHHYLTTVLEEPDGSVQGFVTWGPTPLTEGVFDLHWIAIDPKQQGQGFGQVLLRFVENEARRGRGRMLLIESSSKSSYASALRFCERSGYSEISRIKDFYRIEDDKLVFCKRLTQ